MPAAPRRRLSFREKYTPFLTGLAIIVFLPVCFYVERLVTPRRGHRATRAGHHVKKMNHLMYQAAQKVWDYHHMHHKLEPAAVIMVFCSSDLRVADHAASLYHQKLAPLLLFSGGFGTGPHSGANLNGWTQPEATIFAERAQELGVPADAILLETEAANTGENVKFSRTLLSLRGIEPERVIVVQKPFMQRRSYATFKKLWPEPDLKISSMSTSLAEYPDSSIDLDTVIAIMVGDLQRIKLYATEERPFQIPQEIPDDVWEANKRLIHAGYTWNLVKD